MGRPQHSQPLPPPEAIRQHFSCRQDGRIVRRDHRLGALAHEPAGYAGADGKLMVGVAYQGRTRRISLLRVAWCLSKGEWPKGPVLPKNGDASDLRESNLIAVKHGAHRPNAAGGRASSLERRQATNAALLQALAERVSPTLAELSEAIGLSEGRVSVRLNKLAARDLVTSPMCVPGRSWCLSPAGRELALSANPVVLDDRDRQVLAALALTSMGTVKLARRVEVCPMTIRRRVRLLVEHGLVFADARRFFAITDEGRRALGPEAPQRPEPWLDTTRISAANAKDVRERGQDDRTTAQRSAHSSMGAAKGAATVRLRKQKPFNAFPEWGLTGLERSPSCPPAESVYTAMRTTEFDDGHGSVAITDQPSRRPPRSAPEA
jgi:Mn-dependent DtxR family transcriptional regulator